MKRLLFISLVLIGLNTEAQIDYSKLIIGRTTGQKDLHDGNSTRIMGFAETLSEEIDIPGPTIYMNEGDSVEIDFWNMSQGAPHTIHLHGLDVDQANDGVPNLSFDVHHMDHGYYRFKAPHAGTYLYHCHVVSTIHVQAGMYGVIIVRPPSGDANTTWDGGETYDREFIWTSSEIDTNWHTNAVLDHDTVGPVMIPSSYTPQYFFNSGFSGTDLTDVTNFYTAAENDKVYLRLSNIGYYGVRYIFPSSVNARTLSSDGRPLATDFVSDTITIMPGERFGTMVQLGSDPLYPVTMEHFNLNNQIVESAQTVTIRTSQANITDINLIQKPLIYPNPSKNGLFYHVNGFDEKFEVQNILGQKISQDNTEFIDLSNESSGIYFVNYKGNNIRIVKD